MHRFEKWTRLRALAFVCAPSVLAGCSFDVIDDAPHAEPTKVAAPSSDAGAPALARTLTAFDDPVGASHFTGATLGAWSMLPEYNELMRESGFSDYTPAGAHEIYLAGFVVSSYEQRTTTWTIEETPRPYFDRVSGPAWVDGSLYAFEGTQLDIYDQSSGHWWSLPVRESSVSSAQNTHDDDDFVYAVANGGELLWTFETQGLLVGQLPLSQKIGPTDQPRIAFDSKSGLLFASPSFTHGDFYSIDPTSGEVSKLASVPDGHVSDTFCADRWGHIYAGGSAASAQLWQYDIATATWSTIGTAPPFASGDGSCTVTDDGWLYLSSGWVGAKIRLEKKW